MLNKNSLHTALLFLCVAAVAAAALSIGFKSLAFALLALALLMMAWSVWKRTFPVFSASITLVLLAVVVTEWLVPIVVRSYPDQTILSYQDGYAGAKTDIGAQPNSGVFKSSRRMKTGETIYDVSYTIGSDNLRVTPNNPVGPYRVNFLGCSYTFGEGIQDNETLPYYFAQEARDVHVKNFGFHGYGPHQALAILESNRDTRGQVNFFLTHPFQAIRSACRPEWTKGAVRFELQEDGSVRRNGFCGDSKDTIANLLAAASDYSNILARVNHAMRSQVNDKDMALYVALIKRMAVVSHDRGQRFVVGFLRGGDGFIYGTSYTNDRLKTEFSMAADEVITLDLDKSWPELRDHYQIHPTDSHPNGRANRERARVLLQHLRKYLQ